MKPITKEENIRSIIKKLILENTAVSGVEILNASNVKLTLENNKKLAIFIYADDCRSSKELSPVIEKAAAINTDMKFVKVNASKQSKMISLLNVDRTPTIIFLDNKETSRIVGNKPAQIVNKIQSMSPPKKKKASTFKKTTSKAKITKRINMVENYGNNENDTFKVFNSLTTVATSLEPLNSNNDSIKLLKKAIKLKIGGDGNRFNTKFQLLMDIFGEENSSLFRVNAYNRRDKKLEPTYHLCNKNKNFTLFFNKNPTNELKTLENIKSKYRGGNLAFSITDNDYTVMKATLDSIIVTVNKLLSKTVAPPHGRDEDRAVEVYGDMQNIPYFLLSQRSTGDQFYNLNDLLMNYKNTRGADNPFPPGVIKKVVKLRYMDDYVQLGKYRRSKRRKDRKAGTESQTPDNIQSSALSGDTSQLMDMAAKREEELRQMLAGTYKRYEAGMDFPAAKKDEKSKPESASDLDLSGINVTTMSDTEVQEVFESFIKDFELVEKTNRTYYRSKTKKFIFSSDVSEKYKKMMIAGVKTKDFEKFMDGVSTLKYDHPNFGDKKKRFQILLDAYNKATDISKPVEEGEAEPAAEVKEAPPEKTQITKDVEESLEGFKKLYEEIAEVGKISDEQSKEYDETGNHSVLLSTIDKDEEDLDSLEEFQDKANDMIFDLMGKINDASDVDSSYQEKNKVLDLMYKDQNFNKGFINVYPDIANILRKEIDVPLNKYLIISSVIRLVLTKRLALASKLEDRRLDSKEFEYFDKSTNETFTLIVSKNENDLDVEIAGGKNKEGENIDIDMLKDNRKIELISIGKSGYVGKDIRDRLEKPQQEAEGDIEVEVYNDNGGYQYTREDGELVKITKDGKEVDVNSSAEKAIHKVMNDNPNDIIKSKKPRPASGTKEISGLEIEGLDEAETAPTEEGETEVGGEAAGGKQVEFFPVSRAASNRAKRVGGVDLGQGLLFSHSPPDLDRVVNKEKSDGSAKSIMKDQLTKARKLAKQAAEKFEDITGVDVPSHIKPGTPHRGADFRSKNELVYAVTGGNVTWDWGGDSDGFTATLVGDNGYTYKYRHLNYEGRIKTLNGKTKRLEAGKPLGVSGETGPANGPHLHLEIIPPGTGKSLMDHDEWREIFSTAKFRK